MFFFRFPVIPKFNLIECMITFCARFKRTILWKKYWWSRTIPAACGPSDRNIWTDGGILYKIYLPGAWVSLWSVARYREIFSWIPTESPRWTYSSWSRNCRCKCSVVLCTATQPEFKENGILPGLPVTPIVPNYRELFEKMKRVSGTFLGTQSLDEISSALTFERQCLSIVNTKRHAHDLYSRIKGKGDWCILLTEKKWSQRFARNIFIDVLLYYNF